MTAQKFPPLKNSRMKEKMTAQKFPPLKNSRRSKIPAAQKFPLKSQPLKNSFTRCYITRRFAVKAAAKKPTAQKFLYTMLHIPRFFFFSHTQKTPISKYKRFGFSACRAAANYSLLDKP